MKDTKRGGVREGWKASCGDGETNYRVPYRYIIKGCAKTGAKENQDLQKSCSDKADERHAM